MTVRQKRPNVLRGRDSIYRNDPRAKAIYDRLEEEVAQATARAYRQFDIIADVDRLQEARTAIEDAIVAHPGAEPAGLGVGVLRQRSGLTLSELARRMGRNRATVRKWEQGMDTRMHVGDLKAAAGALGVDSLAILMVVDEIRAEVSQAARPN